MIMCSTLFMEQSNGAFPGVPVQCIEANWFEIMKGQHWKCIASMWPNQLSSFFHQTCINLYVLSMMVFNWGTWLWSNQTVFLFVFHKGEVNPFWDAGPYKSSEQALLNGVGSTMCSLPGFWENWLQRLKGRIWTPIKTHASENCCRRNRMLSKKLLSAEQI